MDSKNFYIDCFNSSSSLAVPRGEKGASDNHSLSDGLFTQLVAKDKYNEYVKMFWVGLMDGDGSIQVNHWREQSLQYRLVIKLSNIPSNYNMLIEIAKVVGGTVRITGKGSYVIWVVNKKQEIEEIIKIYDTYPPLTSKKNLSTCILKNMFNWNFGKNLFIK